MGKKSAKIEKIFLSSLVFLLKHEINVQISMKFLTLIGDFWLSWPARFRTDNKEIFKGVIVSCQCGLCVCQSFLVSKSCQNSGKWGKRKSSSRARDQTLRAKRATVIQHPNQGETLRFRNFIFPLGRGVFSADFLEFFRWDFFVR